MTDKEKIRKFIVSIADADCCNSQVAKIIEKKILPYIDSLKEEPAPKIFEDMLNAKTPAESLGISAEEHEKIIDLCLYGKEPEMVDIDDLPKEEPVSDDLEIEIKHCIYEPFFDLDGVAVKGATKYLTVEDIADIARHFAIWQKQKDQETIELAEDHAILAGMEKMKEQMMKDAIDYRINDMPNQPPIVLDHYRIHEKGIRAGDKVKIIIIKED